MDTQVLKKNTSIHRSVGSGWVSYWTKGEFYNNFQHNASRVSYFSANLSLAFLVLGFIVLGVTYCSTVAYTARHYIWRLRINQVRFINSHILYIYASVLYVQTGTRPQRAHRSKARTGSSCGCSSSTAALTPVVVAVHGSQAFTCAT